MINEFSLNIRLQASTVNKTCSGHRKIYLQGFNLANWVNQQILQKSDTIMDA